MNSWKAEAGTAAALDDELREFYLDGAKAFSTRGECEIRILEIDGRPIASTLCLVHDGVVWGLKNSFDMNYAHLSPGMAAFLHLVEDSWCRGMKEIEFNGDKEYLARWTPTRKPYCRMAIFSSRPYSTAHRWGWSLFAFLKRRTALRAVFRPAHRSSRCQAA